MARRKARGIIKRVDGSTVRFALDRRDGLHVRRGRRRKEKLISWQQLLDLAEGQIRMNLI
ncbi:MAG TPA: hypothetical protein VGO57_18000 [Verrucomicrobiae bacterium]|jgi:hypothetical protein